MRRILNLDLTETNMFLELSLICLACVENYKTCTLTDLLREHEFLYLRFLAFWHLALGG